MSCKNYRFINVPIEEETLKVVDNPQHGKNMFALGLLAEIYDRDLAIIEKQIAHIFQKKPAKVTELNIELVKRGMAWARENLDFRFHVKTIAAEETRVVMNGNQAAALGAVAVITRHEIVFFIMGGIFVLETVSVILQVASFKLTGKRIFRMAPIHHHYELKGWPEPRVIVRFWIITVILVLIGLGTLKIR